MAGQIDVVSGRLGWSLLACVLWCAGGVAMGQGPGPVPAAGGGGGGGALPPGITITTPGEVVRDPRAVNMERLLRPVSFDVTDARLENVLEFVRDVTDADITPLWIEDREPEGLRKDQLITMKVENLTALSAIERLLRSATDEFDAGTWQFAESGELQIGPRSRLNKFHELKVYDINDLTFTLRDVSEIPSIDLSSLGQGQGGGGGGGGGLFEEEEDDENGEPSQEEQAQQIIELIQTFVETEQWESNGGSAGTIRFFRGALLIRAPDYMHRQIDGYRWWTNRRVARAVSAGAFPDETPEARARQAADERRRAAEADRERRRQEIERRRQERDRGR